MAIVAELADVSDRIDESTPQPEGGRSPVPKPVAILDLQELTSELLDDLAPGSNERTAGLATATDVKAYGSSDERRQKRGVGASETQRHRLYDFPAATAQGSTADLTPKTGHPSM